MIPPIVTARLELAPVSVENAHILWQLLQQPGLREFQDLPDVDAAQFRRMVATRPRTLDIGSWGRYEWLIHDRSDGKAVGWTSLRIGERSAATAEVGYSVVLSHRNRGIASEALRAMVDEGFSRADLRKIRAYCVPENAASRRVLERAGFIEDGMLPHGATVQGRPVDVLGFIMERSRWLARRQPA